MTNLEFNLQTKEWKGAYDIYRQCLDCSFPPAKIVQTISSYIKTISPSMPDDASSILASKLYTNFTLLNRESGQSEAHVSDDSILIPDRCVLTPSELYYVHKFLSERPSVHLLNSTDIVDAIASTLTLDATPEGLPSTTENKKIMKLILSLAFLYRLNFHHSGWVKYDRKAAFYLAGLSKIPVSEQEMLINIIHHYYGLNMRVVGSNNPIPCYQFTWSDVQPPTPNSNVDAPGSTTDLIDLGPLTPDTIESLVTAIASSRVSTIPTTKNK